MLSQQPTPSQALQGHAAPRRASPPTSDRLSALRRASRTLSPHRPRHVPSRLPARTHSGSHDDATAGAAESDKKADVGDVVKERDDNEDEDDEDDEDEDDEDDRPSKRARFDTSDEDVSLRHADDDDNTGEPLRFPARPKQSKPWARSRGFAGENATRRADDLTPPTMATVLFSDIAADFCPWTGHDPEDIINEQVIKSGYCDKGPSPNQSESGTARASVWPSLTIKNNVALHTLSLLYAQVLDRRQLAGRVTVPPTFKPPPRVTVTDTKREAWLRDLANPTVPLKKQSRTIPHGIRGKVLLEQCLLKTIPLQRAVWLVKCVGANELRAFRRKGMSGTTNAQGESKWIREWTVSVTQFIQDVLRTTPGDGWHARVQYTIKLVVSLFGEDLLERAYFLDWLVSTLKGISLDHLPLSLLLLRVFWKAIISFEQRGRQVVLTILGQLKHINESGSPIYEPVKKQLQTLLAAVSVQASGCLVIPQDWLKNEQSVLGSLTAQNAESIRFRNQRLSVPSAVARQLVDSPLHQVYALLDSVDLGVNVVELTRACSSIITDVNSLVSALLRWCGSLYRQGRARIVLVREALKHLAENGHDLDPAILAFLPTRTAQSDNIVSVICGLFQSNCLSSGRFMQWLIASGVLSTKEFNELPFKLLLALPTGNLSRHLLNTRAALLSRTSYVQDVTHDDLVARLEACLEHQRTQLDDQIRQTLPNSTFATCISEWARSKALSLVKNNALTVTAFGLFRDIHEALHDIAALRMLLELATLTDDFRVVGAAADTINTHAQELSIIFALQQLTDGLVERYRMLRRQQSLERSSIYALRNLVKDIGHDSATIRFLNGDIAVFEQQNFNNACSPASDNLIGMHAGSLDSDSEIEAVFASGNTMDEHLMKRVFQRVMQRAEQHQPDLTAVQSLSCRWLVQLRMLDRGSFDKVAGEHACQLVQTSNDKALRPIYALVAADCFGFEALLQSLDDNVSTPASKSMLKLLAAPLPTDLALNPLERYHLEHQRMQFCLKQSVNIARLLQQALQYPLLEYELECLFNLFVRLPSELCDSVSTASAKDDLTRTNFKLLCSKALADESHPLTVSSVVDTADHLNLAFCIGWLRCASLQEVNDVKDALLGAVITGSPVWPHLLRSAPSSSIKGIHDWAFEQLVKGDINTSRSHVERMSLCCTILDITADICSSDDHTSGISSVALRLRATGKFLTGNSPSAVIVTQIRLLLHIVILFTQHSTKAEPHLQGLTHTALALCALLAQRKLHEFDDLMQHIHDVTSQVVDKLPSEVLPRLLKSLANAGLYHNSVQHLLGSVNDDTGLVVSTSLGGPQQRTLSRQQSQTALRTPTSSTQQGKMPMLNSRQNSTVESQVRYAPYTLRKWELMQDPTPVVGENDSSISLSLFGARKV